MTTAPAAAGRERDTTMTDPTEAELERLRRLAFGLDPLTPQAFKWVKRLSRETEREARRIKREERRAKLEAKKIRRAERERLLGGKTRAASIKAGRKLYSVIMVDLIAVLAERNDEPRLAPTPADSKGDDR
jgi:hypothetical protein